MELYTIPIANADQDDAFILYRPLIGLAFIGNRSMVKVAQSLAQDPSLPVREDIGAFLEQVGFFTPDPPVPMPPPAGAFNPQSLALLLTNQCQLRCIYCYAAAGEFPTQHLPLEAGFAAIDYVYESLKRSGFPRFSISLHGGGEPTFVWKTLKALVEYAKQKSIPCDFNLTSNGIWSKQQTEWIMKNISAVGISMDGSPSTQDAQRPIVSGNGSSRLVMRTLRQMDESGFSYGLRLTAVPPFDRLIDDIRYLCENTLCQEMQVEAAFNTRRGEENEPNMEEGLAFLKAFFAAQREAERYGRRLRCAGSDVNKITTIACSSPFNTLVVTPQSNIVACFEIVNDRHPLAGMGTIGRINEGRVQIDEEARARLWQKIEARRASCRECFCYWSCAGDCLIRWFTPQPNSHLHHGVRCELNRVLLREMLMKQVAAGQGVWKRTTH